MSARTPEQGRKRQEEIAALRAAAEELAERLDRARLFRAAAYVSMAIDVIRQAKE